MAPHALHPGYQLFEAFIAGNLPATLAFDYNTRVVLLGTMLLGAAAGLVGTFLVLRKRALLGDVVGHATLPGIALAFLVAEILAPGTGRHSGWLLLGATLAGLVSAVAIAWLSRLPRVGPDTAQAAILGLFFGLGAALFRLIQQLPTGNAAGLNGYLYGKASALVTEDVLLFLAAGLLIALLIGLFHQQLLTLCFDPEYAATLGLPVKRLDLLLTGLAVLITVLGLQSVGLILVVATLTIPPAVARFWTDHAGTMALFASGIGALGAAVGVLLSASFTHIPTGATIVLVLGLLFFVSLLIGRQGGLLWRPSRRSSPLMHATK